MPNEANWVIYMDTAHCEVSQTRRLDRYALEHIFTLQEKTKLLLLMRTTDDDKHFGGKSGKVNYIQGLDMKVISGSEYFQMMCTISDATHNELVTGGVGRGVYSQVQFMKDLKTGNGGVSISIPIIHNHSPFQLEANNK